MFQKQIDFLLDELSHLPPEESHLAIETRVDVSTEWFGLRVKNSSATYHDFGKEKILISE